jgi:hypothetical protein
VTKGKGGRGADIIAGRGNVKDTECNAVAGQKTATANDFPTRRPQIR